MLLLWLSRWKDFLTRQFGWPAVNFCKFMACLYAVRWIRVGRLASRCSASAMGAMCWCALLARRGLRRRSARWSIGRRFYKHIWRADSFWLWGSSADATTNSTWLCVQPDCWHTCLQATQGTRASATHARHPPQRRQGTRHRQDHINGYGGAPRRHSGHSHHAHDRGAASTPAPTPPLISDLGDPLSKWGQPAHNLLVIFIELTLINYVVRCEALAWTRLMVMCMCLWAAAESWWSCYTGNAAGMLCTTSALSRSHPSQNFLAPGWRKRSLPTGAVQSTHLWAKNRFEIGLKTEHIRSISPNRLVPIFVR